MADLPLPQNDRIAWTPDSVAGIPLRRTVASVGEIEVGAVEYDGSNRLWTWSSRLADDAWGHATDEQGARLGLESWLRRWLANFASFFRDARS
jgi:hypothetical protein